MIIEKSSFIDLAPPPEPHHLRRCALRVWWTAAKVSTQRVSRHSSVHFAFIDPCGAVCVTNGFIARQEKKQVLHVVLIPGDQCAIPFSTASRTVRFYHHSNRTQAASEPRGHDGALHQRSRGRHSHNRRREICTSANMSSSSSSALRHTARGYTEIIGKGRARVLY